MSESAARHRHADDLIRWPVRATARAIVEQVFRILLRRVPAASTAASQASSASMERRRSSHQASGWNQKTRGSAAPATGQRIAAAGVFVFVRQHASRCAAGPSIPPRRKNQHRREPADGDRRGASIARQAAVLHDGAASQPVCLSRARERRSDRTHAAEIQAEERHAPRHPVDRIGDWVRGPPAMSACGRDR